MKKIIRFPKEEDAKLDIKKSIPSINDSVKGIVSGIVRFIWVMTVLIWPMLKWLLSLEVFFQLVRMFYYWNTPGIYAGWTFALHFSLLTALTYFVSIYKPKGI